jgi:hypothetical protein
MGEGETYGLDTRREYEPMRIVHELVDDPEATLQAAAMVIWDRVLDAAERLRETGVDEDELHDWLKDREYDVLGLIYQAMLAVEVARRVKDPTTTHSSKSSTRRRDRR